MITPVVTVLHLTVRLVTMGFSCLQVMAFPVMMLVRFWVNHHLLDLTQRPVWRVVKDRSRTYVQKILDGIGPPAPRNPPLTSSVKRSDLMLCE